jgi:SOS regulatory protein LexA
MVKSTKMEFKNWLKHILETRNMKMSELAYRSGVSDAEISRLMSGQRQPSAKTIKKLVPFLHVTEEEGLRAGGFLPPEKEKPQTVTIPLVGECPADNFNFAYENATDTVTVNYDFLKDKNCFAVRVKGDCLKDIGIFSNDIVIISPHAEISNGDIVVARIEDECTMKRFFRTNDQIILQPCNNEYTPIIIDPKNKNIEIVGKVIRALKTFA